MRNWTIGKRLLFGFGIVVAIVTALGAYSFGQLRAIQAASDRVVKDSLPGTALSGQVLAHVKNDLAFTLEHLSASTASEMDVIEAEIAKNGNLIATELVDYEKTITQQDDRDLFDKIEPARARFVSAFGQTIALSKAGKKDDALQLFRTQLRPSYEALGTTVTDLSDWNVAAGAAAGADVAGAVSSTVTGVVAGVLLAVVAAVVVGLFVIRGIEAVLNSAVNNLRQGAEQVAAASGQVATASQSLSQGATEQAASLEETSASMEEMVGGWLAARWDVPEKITDSISWHHDPDWAHDRESAVIIYAANRLAHRYGFAGSERDLSNLPDDPIMLEAGVDAPRLADLDMCAPMLFDETRRTLPPRPAPSGFSSTAA